MEFFPNNFLKRRNKENTEQQTKRKLSPLLELMQLTKEQLVLWPSFLLNCISLTSRMALIRPCGAAPPVYVYLLYMITYYILDNIFEELQIISVISFFFSTSAQTWMIYVDKCLFFPAITCTWFSLCFFISTELGHSVSSCLENSDRCPPRESSILTSFG